MIYDHNIFICQKLINSGMILINLDILKSFVDDRNSFIIEEREKLGLYKNAIPIMNELQITSYNNERMENFSLDVNMIISQENEETSITTPTNASAAIPLNTMVFQPEEMHSHPEVQLNEKTQ